MCSGTPEKIEAYLSKHFEGISVAGKYSPPASKWPQSARQQISSFSRQNPPSLGLDFDEN
jgi:hypothetical protein